MGIKRSLLGIVVGGGVALVVFLAAVVFNKAILWLTEVFGPNLAPLLVVVVLFSFMGAIFANILGD